MLWAVLEAKRDTDRPTHMGTSRMTPNNEMLPGVVCAMPAHLDILPTLVRRSQAKSWRLFDASEKFSGRGCFPLATFGIPRNGLLKSKWARCRIFTAQPAPSGRAIFLLAATNIERYNGRIPKPARYWLFVQRCS